MWLQICMDYSSTWIGMIFVFQVMPWIRDGSLHTIFSYLQAAFCRSVQDDLKRKQFLTWAYIFHTRLFWAAPIRLIDYQNFVQMSSARPKIPKMMVPCLVAYNSMYFIRWLTCKQRLKACSPLCWRFVLLSTLTAKFSMNILCFSTGPLRRYSVVKLEAVRSKVDSLLTVNQVQEVSWSTFIDSLASLSWCKGICSQEQSENQ